MNVEFFRRCCLAFPYGTESLPWGNNLVFKVAGKMFCITVKDALAKAKPAANKKSAAKKKSNAWPN
jgi:predicted DNA-binding protein (MmcQ/YjbR family)